MTEGNKPKNSDKINADMLNAKQTEKVKDNRSDVEKFIAMFKNAVSDSHMNNYEYNKLGLVRFGFADGTSIGVRALMNMLQGFDKWD